VAESTVPEFKNEESLFDELGDGSDMTEVPGQWRAAFREKSNSKALRRLTFQANQGDTGLTGDIRGRYGDTAANRKGKSGGALDRVKK